MKFGSMGYNISSFAIIVLLLAHTMVMTILINEQKDVDLSTMLILYANVAFICVMFQMHVTSRLRAIANRQSQ
jgi:hypothetical protein